DQQGEQRETDDQSKCRQSNRKLLPGDHLALARPALYEQRADDTDNEAYAGKPCAFAKHRRRKEETAIVEVGIERQMYALARLRQHRENAEIPEEDDQ